ncbi:unnamed protein product [Withania somnifera]
MDVYGVSAPDLFRIDDLLDFSNDQIFSNTTPDSHHHHHQPHSHNSSSSTTSINTNYFVDALLPNSSDDFTDNLCVPSDDVAELEWLSNFVEDSFTNFPANSITGTMNLSSNTASFHGRSRSKRSRSTSSWTTSLQNPNTNIINGTKNKESSVHTRRERSLSTVDEDVPRRCTHCASEKTPQWRTGPLGPKTLCNACGVRYKSGRLVPEYRPAASPTFVLTQHSNSHRKVMELRRQKEMQQLSTPTEEGMYGRHFRAC